MSNNTDINSQKIPVARDDTMFTPDMCNKKGLYRVGEKYNEQSFDDYHEALSYLRQMKVAKWRRPNDKGNWGIVSAIAWQKTTIGYSYNQVDIEPRRETMSTLIRTKNPAKAWLAEFLLSRGVLGGPSGLPLYRFQVGQDEYESLWQMLVKDRASLNDPVKKYHWNACFCLFVSEHFRREYDASQGGWSWHPFEKILRLDLSPGQRSEIVETGLVKYWKRPMRKRESGRDLLGSLFVEGGLPWKLVQSETHGFARAIRGGLKNYYSVKGSGRTTTDLMSDYIPYLPHSFRSFEFQQILAGIIEQLISLVENYPLAEKEDPTGYLDQNVEDWRNDFPIPLGEENGRELITEWLKTAEQRRTERAVSIEKLKEFTCTHQLQTFSDECSLIASVILPKEYKFEADFNSLNSTRFEVAFFEGENLLARGGTLYGKQEDSSIKVKFRKLSIDIQRKNLNVPLSLALMESGKVVSREVFENSEFNLDESLLGFIKEEGCWKFHSSNSFEVNNNEILLRIPKQFEYDINSTIVQHTEKTGSNWVLVSGEITLSNGVDKYFIKKGTGTSPLFSLVGSSHIYASTPKALYRNWPRPVWNDGIEETDIEFLQYVDGVETTNHNVRDKFGSFKYQIKSKEGNTLLRRKFGVLPHDLSISTKALNNKDVDVVITSTKTLSVALKDEFVKELSRQVSQENNSIKVTTITCAQVEGKDKNFFKINVSSENESPVTIQLPFPKEGIQLIDRFGEDFLEQDLYVEDLLGLRLILSSSDPLVKYFHIDFSLVGESSNKISRHQPISVIKGTSEVSLFAFHDELVNLLGTSANQDCFIRMSVSGANTHLALNIRRFNGVLSTTSEGSYSIRNFDGKLNFIDADVNAMLISDPKQKPVSIVENLSQGVGTGVFEIPNELHKGGLWLLYPDPQAPCQFRPELFFSNAFKTRDAIDVNNIKSLHQATETFHPFQAPDVIDHQIALLSSDLDGSGWQYILDLKDYFGHLTLSTFETWKALANNDLSLALSVFRLEFDQHFCDRIKNELAVIWESIPLSTWKNAFKIHRSWIKKSGVPESLLDSVLKNRETVLPEIVPGFEEFKPLLLGEVETIKAHPIEVILPIWNAEELDKFDPDLETWPKHLGSELRNWVLASNFPDSLKNLSIQPNANAVIYLPIFMAYVTAGLASLEELNAQRSHIRYMIKEVSSFSFQDWYLPVHGTVLSYLLSNYPEIS